MSVHVMSLVYSAKLGNPYRKAVALKMADHANDDGGSVYPSLARLAAEAEVSLSTVQRTIRDMLDMGIITVVAAGGSGPGSTTQYQFELKRLAELPRTWVPAEKVVRQTTMPMVVRETRWSRGPGKVVCQTRLGSLAGTNKPSLTIREPSTREGAEGKNFDSEGQIVRDRLLARFGPDVFREWFSNLTFLPNGGVVAVEAPTPFVCNWLRTRHEDAIREACQAAWPAVSRITIVSNDNAATVRSAGVGS